MNRPNLGTPQCLLFLAMGLLLPSGVGHAQDASLFRTNVTPNILLIVDNSKSMTNTVWHADYGRSNPPGSPVNNAGDLEWKKQDSTLGDGCSAFREAMVRESLQSFQPVTEDRIRLPSVNPRPCSRKSSIGSSPPLPSPDAATRRRLRGFR